jgi:hypothetical protein
MPLNSRAFQDALKKKGFVLDRRTNDNVYYLWVGERRTSIFTKASMGRGEVLGDPLVSKIKKQMRLEKAQLFAFVDCAIDGAEYVRLLRVQGILEEA